MLGIVPADIQYHDTYFVVAHFHYVLVTGALWGIIAAVFYWLPKWTGKMYNERLGKVHFWWAMISVNVAVFPSTLFRACRNASSHSGLLPCSLPTLTTSLQLEVSLSVYRLCCLLTSLLIVYVMGNLQIHGPGIAPKGLNGRCLPRHRTTVLIPHQLVRKFWQSRSTANG